MHTDKTAVLSVCICVHLWLIVLGFTAAALPRCGPGSTSVNDT